MFTINNMGIAVRLLIFAGIVFVIFKGISAAYQFGHSIFYAVGIEEAPGRNIDVTVTEGTGVKDAAELLKKKGLIDNEWSFRVQAKFFDLKITPGTYLLNTSQSSKEMLETLNAGPDTENGAKSETESP